MKPHISIIMPAHKRLSVIDFAINSIKQQTYSNWELIIVDDYGDDELERHIKNSHAACKSISVISNERTKGISGARNTGILHSSGDYIAFLDSDDEWLPNHLRDLIDSMLSENTKAGFSLWYEEIDGRRISIVNDNFNNLLNLCIEATKAVQKGNHIVFYKDDFFPFTMKTFFYCYHLNTMIIERYMLFNQVGMFDEKIKSSEDMDFIFRIISQNSFVLEMDYHYVYKHNVEGTYSFINRQDTSVFDIQGNASVCNKMVSLGEEKIIVRKRSLELIRKFFSNDYKECKNIVDLAIYKKYYTMGVLNYNINKEISEKYFIEALKFIFNIKDIYQFVCKNIINTNSIDLW
jgi:glycosyltransferase involved in cell wall biosynthesis